MDNYIEVTDTHVGYKNNDYWKQIHLELFKKICKTAKEYNIKKMIHLGDFFDDRKNLNINYAISFTMNEIIPLLIDTFDTIYIIMGNHDTYFKNSNDVNSLSIFRYIKNFVIIDEPTLIDDQIKLFPWGYVPQEEDKEYICMGHWEINGVIINAHGDISKNFKYNLSDFKDIKQVDSGHFHTPGNYSNVSYIGAPYHMSHNDKGKRGYYTIYDCEKEFIEFNGPEFMDLYISVGGEMDVLKITNIENDVLIRKNDGDFKPLSNIDYTIKHNHIRLIYLVEMGSTLTSQINDYIQSFDPKTIKVKFSFINNNETDENDVVEISDDEKDLLMNYISSKNTPPHINKKILTKLIEKIINE